MSYLYVTGNQNALDTITEDLHIKQCIYWIVLLTAAQRNPIFDDYVGGCVGLYTMNFNDIDTMTKDYGS